MGNLQGRPAGRPCSGQIIFWKIPIPIRHWFDPILSVFPQFRLCKKPLRLIFALLRIRCRLHQVNGELALPVSGFHFFLLFSQSLFSGKRKFLKYRMFQMPGVRFQEINTET